MKTERLIVALFALTLVFVPQSAEPRPREHKYSATLITPTPGQVLIPGQTCRIQWTSTLPDINPSLCETELRLSLDGGRTFTWLTGERDPTVKYFDWVVPNTPSRAAVIDVHFGCLGYYPETASIQTQAAFVISPLN